MRAIAIGRIDLIAVIASQHAPAPVNNEHTTISAALTEFRRVITHDTSTADMPRSEGLKNDRQTFYVQNANQKLQAILAGIGIGHLPRKGIQSYLDDGALSQVNLGRSTNMARFIGWQANNKGKGLQALCQLLASADWHQ